MNASEGILSPVAVALHTRDREEDYRWIAEVGTGLLVEDLKKLHRELVADQDARPAATFILLDHRERLGLLVANLKTSRQDHMRTVIDDIILLEFTCKDREAVFHLAAGLLATEVQNLQLTLLLDYAEARFRQKQDKGGIETGEVTVAALAVLPIAQIEESADLLRKEHVALSSNAVNQQRVVGLLIYLSTQIAELKRPCVVVSTGFVGKEKLRQQAQRWQRFVALTRSSSISEDEDVRLEPVEDEKKKANQMRRGASGPPGRDIGTVVGKLSHVVEHTLELVRNSLLRPLQDEIDRLHKQITRLEDEIDRLRRESERRGEKD